MFGLNQVRTAKYFADQAPGHLKVTSVFYTLQGEGPFSGQPSVFVRLSHCHLSCSFCDTWFETGDVMSFYEIGVAALNSVKRSETINSVWLPELFVVTGGEPLLQPQLAPFIEWLHAARGTLVQVETTGTVIPPGLLSIGRDRLYIVCSPKRNARGQPLRIAPEMLDRIDCMKCVVSASDSQYRDVPELVLEWHDSHPDRPVYISPMNVYREQPIRLGPDGTLQGRSEVDERVSFWTPGLLDQEANRANHERAARLALHHRVRLSLQTHLYASLP
jgi:7-carboxy-7-deazaguanine synthase